MQGASAYPVEVDVITGAASVPEQARVPHASILCDSSDEEEIQNVGSQTRQQEGPSLNAMSSYNKTSCADVRSNSLTRGRNEGKSKIARKFAPSSMLKTGYRFVYKARHRWQVRVKHHGKVWYCGVYNTKEDAARAADWKSHALGLPASKLNFPADPKPTAQVMPALDYHTPRSRPNKTMKNKTGYRGVYHRPTGGFYCQVYCSGKSFALPGPYTTAMEAAQAFDKKAVELGRGSEFLNFPNTYPMLHAEYERAQGMRLDMLVLGYLRDRKLHSFVTELKAAGFGAGSFENGMLDLEIAPDGLPVKDTLLREFEQAEHRNSIVGRS